jgi:signal transduction histidine kinase
MMQGNKNIQDISTTLGSLENVQHIRIFNDNGVIKYASKTNEIGKNISEIDPEHILLKNLDQTSVRLVGRNDAYSISEPIINEEGCQSCHGVDNKTIAFLDLDTHLTKAETVFFTGSYHFLFLGIALVLILTIGLYLIFTQLIIKPLTGLNRALKIVEEGNLEINMPTKRNDEIGKVYKRFNLMLQKLKSSKEKIEELHFDQLQRADRLTTLGELTSQVAHEVNNHAAVIMSRTDFLEMEISRQPDLDSYKEDLNTILDQTNKISAITKNLLRHSKQSTSNKEKIDLGKTIDHSIFILQPLLKKKKIVCSFKSEIQNCIVIADELQIEQVMTNLILNAADAVDEDGKIDVSLTSDNENRPIIFIKDNGQGIEPDAIDKIFSPFYTSKSQGKGTGLGLYIVQNICKSHDIDIKCDSDLGTGTTFRLLFRKTD